MNRGNTAACVLLGLFLFAGSLVSLPQEPPPAEVMGYAVSSGAAAGYVDSRACAVCHAGIYADYQQVGMARSFARPTPEVLIEDLRNGRFYHAPSRQHFEVNFRDDRLTVKRYQRDDAGRAINVYEQRVDWILGSGNTSRTYLFQTPSGELFQLPLAWYSQERKWGMAPGFDLPYFENAGRPVRRECMFCHNAYPDVPAGSDRFDQPHTYPTALPAGIGCQRCHGPGAEHVRLASAAEPATTGAVRDSIVNPGRLPPRLRDDTCDQCHFQPSVAIPGIRRFGRTTYSYRPGRPLSDYQMAVDIEEEGLAASERFEINHHPYRLRQSPCHLKSREGLNCLTCHDPHRKVVHEEREQHFRRACLTCHASRDCSRPSTAGEGNARPPGDCVSCHMPRRRTQDVVQVVMTDHRIQRPGDPRALLAARPEREPVVTDIRLLNATEDGVAVDVYRSLSILEVASRASRPAVDSLEQIVARGSFPPEVDIPLARGQLAWGRNAAAADTLLRVLRGWPDNALALEWLGIARARSGRLEAAVTPMKRALGRSGERVELRYNLGRILLGLGRLEEAAAHLRSAIELRPNLAPAVFQLGNAHRRSGNRDDAIRSYRRTLELDPVHSGAYVELGRALIEIGETEEALRYWNHGVKVSNQPEPIAEALAAARNKRQ